MWHLLRSSTTKSITLKSPAMRVIHALLCYIITRRNHYTSNNTMTGFKYLLSMVDRTLYYSGYVITNSFHQQAIDTKGHTIFTEPYITRLIKGMGLLGDMNHLPTVGWYNPISLHSLHMMGPISPQHPMGTAIPLAADPSSFIGHPSLYCLGWSLQRIADHCMSSSAPPANNYSPEETS